MHDVVVKELTKIDWRLNSECFGQALYIRFFLYLHNNVSLLIKVPHIAYTLFACIFSSEVIFSMRKTDVSRHTV